MTFTLWALGAIVYVLLGMVVAVLLTDGFGEGVIPLVVVLWPAFLLLVFLASLGKWTIPVVKWMKGVRK